jgi:threonine/homoserine/homoserine lactone efflux protein
MLREGDLATQGAEAAAEPIGRVLRRAIVLNLLNPKLTVFFFAVLPPFLDASTKTVDPRLLALGGVFMVIKFVVFAVYAIVSAWLRDRIVRARRARLWFQRTLAGLLVAFGARLALNDR